MSSSDELRSRFPLMFLFFCTHCKFAQSSRDTRAADAHIATVSVVTTTVISLVAKVPMSGARCRVRAGPLVML